MSVDNYLERLKNQKFFRTENEEGSIRYYIKWYREHAPTKRFLFRTAGLVALFLSISLPFIIGLVDDEMAKAKVASGIAWAIALAGAANGFFQWNKTWQGYVEAQFRLERLLMEWELAVSAYSGKSDENSLEIVEGLTKAFVISSRSAITDETKSYFEEVKFPNLNVEKETPENQAGT